MDPTINTLRRSAGAVILSIYTFLVSTVQSRAISLLRQPHVDNDGTTTNNNGLSAILILPGRRAIDINTLARARFLYEAITKKLLRQNIEVPEIKEVDVGDDETAGLVENELKNTLSKNTSAILRNPTVEHRGENDFLVLQSNAEDPFVTVVPNDMYYNVEKRCVNWLDDCNAMGIRERLLQKVQSPYR